MRRLRTTVCAWGAGRGWEMSTETMSQGDLSGSHVKIGVPSHMGRNAGFLAGAVLLGGAIYGFYRYSSHKDGAELGQLDTFRSAYAAKCDAPAWKGEVSSVLRDNFLNSSELRDTVDQQLTALNSGATCENVMKALKAASFPMPAPSSATP